MFAPQTRIYIVSNGVAIYRFCQQQKYRVAKQHIDKIATHPSDFCSQRYKSLQDLRYTAKRCDMCWRTRYACGRVGIYIISQGEALYRICFSANISRFALQNISLKEGIQVIRFIKQTHRPAEHSAGRFLYVLLFSFISIHLTTQLLGQFALIGLCFSLST